MLSIIILIYNVHRISWDVFVSNRLLEYYLETTYCKKSLLVGYKFLVAFEAVVMLAVSLPSRFANRLTGLPQRKREHPPGIDGGRGR